MTDNRSLLKLMPEQREDLQRWAQSRTLPAGDVFRARLIVALADGSTYREIARSLKTSLPTIARWKIRFERDGLAGLQGRHLGSKPRAATPKVQARVIRRVQQPPGDGSTHWSCRKLASELGLSKSTVQRILAQAQLQPHRLERYRSKALLRSGFVSLAGYERAELRSTATRHVTTRGGRTDYGQ
jgi:putative transposase